MANLNAHYSLTSNTYKNQVFEGFSRLQQCDEFVDMTLVTGDHLVKVHKTLIVLASSYLKALLQSIPCQHPVLFLSNVSSEDLHFILEYIYTGEVKIPSKNIETFLNAARALHISGLENIMLPKTNNTPNEEKQESEAVPETLKGVKRFPAVKASIIIKENDFNLQVEPNVEIPNTQNNNGKNFPLPVLINVPSGENNHLPSKANKPLSNLADFNVETSNSVSPTVFHGDANNENINLDTGKKLTSENIDNIPMIFDGMLPLTPRPFFNIGKKEIIITNTDCNNIELNMPIDTENINRTSFANLFKAPGKLPLLEAEDAPGNVNTNGLNGGKMATQSTTNETAASNVNQEQAANGGGGDKDSILYTISKRGSLQLIMNRFMYYTHYTRDGGRKRRWRCIEYRDSHCPASMDADGDVIVARKNMHCHPNHDKKIWNKVVKSRVFSSLKMAQDVINERQKTTKPEAVVLSD